MKQHLCRLNVNRTLILRLLESHCIKYNYCGKKSPMATEIYQNQFNIKFAKSVTKK